LFLPSANVSGPENETVSSIGGGIQPTTKGRGRGRAREKRRRGIIGGRLGERFDL
jgi:hypothetical protein